MNKSQIFKAAHENARKIVKIVGDYVVAFSYSLKEVYAGMKKSVAEQLNELGFVKVSAWKDRFYINLAGNGGNFAGERNAKIWFKEGESLNVQLGKGICSSEWHEQLEQVKAIFA